MRLGIPIIERYKEIHADSVIRIANDSFGAGYMSLCGIKNLADNGGPFYIAKDADEVAGYCCFTYTPAEVCAAYMKLPETILQKNAGADGRVCITKTMAVTNSYKGTGLADRLFEACLRDAQVAGIRSAWGSAWKIGESVPMRRIFEKNGFQAYGEIPLIWYDDKMYKCLVCDGPCKCTGVIYYKILGCV